MLPPAVLSIICDFRGPGSVPCRDWLPENHVALWSREIFGYEYSLDLFKFFRKPNDVEFYQLFSRLMELENIHMAFFEAPWLQPSQVHKYVQLGRKFPGFCNIAEILLRKNRKLQEFLMVELQESFWKYELNNVTLRNHGVVQVIPFRLSQSTSTLAAGASLMDMYEREIALRAIQDDAPFAWHDDMAALARIAIVHGGLSAFMIAFSSLPKSDYPELLQLAKDYCRPRIAALLILS